MGSQQSLVVINSLIEYFAKVVIDSFSSKPERWFRYIDETIIIWCRGRNSFLNYLNYRKLKVGLMDKVVQIHVL